MGWAVATKSTGRRWSTCWTVLGIIDGGRPPHKISLYHLHPNSGAQIALQPGLLRLYEQSITWHLSFLHSTSLICQNRQIYLTRTLSSITDRFWYILVRTDCTTYRWLRLAWLPEATFTRGSFLFYSSSNLPNYPTCCVSTGTIKVQLTQKVSPMLSSLTET